MIKSPAIRVDTLGIFRIVASGRVVRFPRAKEKALIAFLAVNPGRSFQRDYLASLFWGSSTEQKAKHSLNNAIYTIRRLLPSLLSTETTFLQIELGVVETDIEELSSHIRNHNLLANLQIIRGEFLADLDMRDAPDFESWRSDFSRHVFFNIEAAAQTEFMSVSPASRAAVAMQLAALAALTPAVNPSAFVEYLSVTENDPPEMMDISDQGTAFLLPFVGRNKQLSVLHEFWKVSQEGTATFINVVGHAGHGKTRLVDEFIRSISNTRILRARCYQSERRISFGPIVEMLTEGLKPADLVGIEPIWLSALHEVVHSLPVDLAAAPQLSAAASQSRLYEAVVRVINSLADQGPLLIFFDDVQWADSSTKALISFLSHRLSAPVLLVVAERLSSSDVNKTPPWRSWPTILVEELSEKQLAETIRALPPAMARVAPPVHELDRLTRGHPYMVAELIRSAAEQPAIEDGVVADNTFVGVQAFLGSLLGELPSNVQRVASSLSVIGRPAPVSLVAKVSRSRDIIPSLNLLSEKGLVSHVNGKVSLKHDLVRESTYRGIPVFTRNELHRRAAVLLAGSPKHVGEAAEHYYHARDRRNSYKLALEAAEAADARYANDESIYFLRMAIKSSTSEVPRLQLMLAERLYRANRTQETTQQIARILANKKALTIQEFITWKLRAFELAYDSGAILGPALRDELQKLLDKIPNNEIDLRVRALHMVTHSAFHDGDRAVAAATQYILKDIADQNQSTDGIIALARAVHGHATTTSVSEANSWAEPLRARLETISDPELKVRTLSALTGVAYAAGRLPEASTYAAQALEVINRVGAMNLWPLSASHAHMLHVEQGRFADALAMDAEIRSRAPEFLDVLSTISANTSIMYFTKREFAEAKEVSRWGLKQLESRKSTWTELVLRSLNALSALELGDFAHAASSAEYAKAQIDALGTRNLDLSYVEILIARVAAMKGHRPAAIQRLREAIAEYADRDTCCRLRMELELARHLKTESRDESRRLARKVFDVSKASNAVIIAEAADALLTRL